MYKLIKDPITKDIKVVKRLEDNAFIPFDDANIDYIEYKKWIALGNTPLPADEV